MYQPQDLAVYIHWPFCQSKCPYCDFYKELNRNVEQDKIIDEYLSALKKYHDLLPERTIKSIFFGGGTPSLISPANIARIINFISAHWHTDDNIEISLEANPNSRKNNLFNDLKSAGINRLSLGVQSLDDVSLRFLGRTHNALTAKLCIEEIVKVFDNHSADLIYALPSQTPQNWLPQLEQICSYGLRHLSLYQLTIEEGTVFARIGIKVLNEDDSVNIYNITRNFLADKKYFHYEVSNFAQPGYVSRHNLTYWQGGDYIGIGKSAHGRIFTNKQHHAVVYPFLSEQLTAEQRAQELIIMGLRLTGGINKKDFADICGINFCDFVNKNNFSQLKEQKLLIESPTHVFAGYDGFLLIDTLAAMLCE